jgi:hypothetical protein
MKLTKNRFFFFCFLFISCLINAGIKPVKPSVFNYSHRDYAVYTPEQDNKKQQLEQLKCISHSCFRLNEVPASGGRNSKNADLLLSLPANAASHFCKRCYSYYTAKRLHCFSNFSLYLRHRRLLI